MAFEQSLHHVMSGAARGPGPAAARAALAVVEPLYTLAVRLRNRRYDRHPDRARRLPRPVVSVGNLTAGGTGKTPVVRWLAERLRDAGRRVAVLSRGYKSAPGTLGDEQRMLDALLNGAEAGGRPPVVIRADPDRHAAGLAALRDCPELDVFLLDDGFQHRRLARDLDVVLVNTVEPFGFGHVLPRGLLREPLAGLRRAGAVVLTHALSADDAGRARVVDEVRRHNPHAPVYRCVHAPAGLRAAGDEAVRPLESLKGRRVFAFCGIGNPAGFERQLRGLAGEYGGHRWFPDHYDYRPADVAAVRAAAVTAGADVLVTTEKDWVKLAALDAAAATNGEIPIWRLDVEARFREDDGERLFQQVLNSLDRARRNVEGSLA